MIGRERNLDSGIERYREMILDATETLLRFFGFDGNVYRNFKKTKEYGDKRQGFWYVITCALVNIPR